MTLHDILLVVQWVTIVGLFLESWIVFHKWNSKAHSYLFFYCVTALINNLGFLMEFESHTRENFITALKFSYAGRAWYCFAMVFFIAEFCKVHVPSLIKNFLALVHLGIYICVFTVENNNLFYTSINYNFDGTNSSISHGNGIVHTIFIMVQMFYIVFALIWLITVYAKSTKNLEKRRVSSVIGAVIVQSILYAVQISGITDLTQYYDVTMFGCFLSTVLMIYAMLSLDLLGTSELAREFVIDRISEGIIAADTDGMVQYYNEPASHLYPNIVKDPEGILTQIKQAVADGENIRINDRIYVPEANILTYKGEEYGSIYALADETDHFNYMEELERQKEIADNANKAKSRFLANMSHEIRTPINAVLGMDEMIMRESREDSIRAYAADIMSAGKTLLSLINDILDLSKVEEGKMEILPVQYALSSLVGDLINMIRERADKKGLELVLNVEEDTPHILIGDEMRLRQCILNLLTNAVKYTEKGSVTLGLAWAKEDDSHIRLRFSVSDTGIGMKEEDLEKLLMPYQRIEEKRNRSIEGTGLGMSITSQLLELMGSRLEIESEYGKGTTISFAVVQEVVSWEHIGNISKSLKNSGDEISEYHELFHAPDARILVIDDTEMNITVIRSLLKMTRINIDSALSGKEGLVLAEKEHYDVIFIDHMMPDMDGIETLVHMRESGANMDTPAVALTANAVSGAREMYLKAGFTNYLSKPVIGTALEKMLYDLIPDDKLLEPAEDEGAEPVQQDSGSESDFVKALSKIPNIDEKTGLEYCGSEEGYMSVLSVFHQTAAEKSDEIESLLEQGDIENYAIKVHALKSSARIIGAAELSALARDLEDSGKSKDLETVTRDTPRLLDMYRTLDEKLSPIFEKEEDLPEITPASLTDAYRTIVEIAGSMDYQLMDELLGSLKQYRLPEGHDDVVKSMESMLSRLDWDGISAVANEVLNGGI